MMQAEYTMWAFWTHAESRFLDSFYYLIMFECKLDPNVGDKETIGIIWPIALSPPNLKQVGTSCITIEKNTYHQKTNGKICEKVDEAYFQTLCE